jgi:hypothetical protein
MIGERNIRVARKLPLGIGVQVVEDKAMAAKSKGKVDLAKFADQMRQPGVRSMLNKQPYKIINTGAKGKATADQLVMKHSERALNTHQTADVITREAIARLEKERKDRSRR